MVHVFSARHARSFAALVACALTLATLPALAQRAPIDHPYLPDSGKLPLTAGFNDVDGVGGGGLVPWALITGYGTADSWGANVHYTTIPVNDFRLQSMGAAVGILDRVELSVASDKFDVTGTALDGARIEQSVYGLKVRLTGDAVYDQDSWAPQTAVGLEYKRNRGIGHAGAVTDPTQLGARSNSGTDWYASATKVLLAQSVLLNLTMRYTDANQFGLLGFGGDLHHGRTLEPEATVAYLVTRQIAVGGEYRGKPHNLSVDDEHGAFDVFAAWSARHVSLVAAYVRLGSILGPATGVSRNQDGAYVSLQVGF